MTDQMHDAGLHHRFRKGGRDGLRKALETVDHGDENVLNTPALQLIHHREPEFGALIVGNPETQNLTNTVSRDAKGHINGLVLDHAAVAIPDLDAQRIENHVRIKTLKSTPLPILHLV